MKYTYIVLLFFIAQLGFSQSELEKKLFLLEDVIFTKIDAPEGYRSAYKLMIRQPLDHENPEAGHFYQRVFLSNKSVAAPSVMVTEGYDRPRNRIYELSRYLDANQIQVEHRFFGASVPDSINYSYLNLKQATADLHRINRLLKSIYKGPFISTGISKGGMTTLFYRYFYPNDVDVSVPYVAPINVDYKDKRIYDFLDNVGDEQCRSKINALQTELLKNKASYLPLVKWFAKGQRKSFDRLGIEGAYELAVLEYSFAFWQFGVDCDKIPSIDADKDEILEHFLSVSGVDFFSDQTIDGYAPFYYQMGNEMGYYGYETDNFEEYITVVGDEPSAVFSPENINNTFEPTLTRKAQKWMTEELERVIYINGAIDTWSATAIDPDDNLDALLFNMDGESHGTARIRNMSEEELALLKNTFERWLKMEIKGYVPDNKKP